MTFHFAARYSRLEQLRVYRGQLEARGHVVLTRWLRGRSPTVADYGPEASAALVRRWAEEDWKDMLASQIVILFAERSIKNHGTGARHVEFGGALALGKLCVVIGRRENPYHYAAAIEHHESWENFAAIFPAEKEGV